MSDPKPTDTEHGEIVDGGASTDTYITGQEEDGEFTTDRPPTSGTAAGGSSNRGINTTSANRQETPD